MNALEIIEEVRAHEAELVPVGRRLFVRGRGERLPGHLHAELCAHRTEVIVAMGGAMGASEILADLRPNLPPNLRALADERLLILVNWSIMAAWEKTIRFAVRP